MKYFFRKPWRTLLLLKLILVHHLEKKKNIVDVFGKVKGAMRLREFLKPITPSSMVGEGGDS